MRTLDHLFENNRAWSSRIRRMNPEFFESLSRQQKPRYLWIGCADSRVPANEIVNLLPGELFVHRNVARHLGDVELLAPGSAHGHTIAQVIERRSEDVLQVEHVIVCGHYGCSGVAAALQNQRVGLADNWLRHVQDVHSKHDEKVSSVPDMPQRIDRLCELNVIEQVANVCQTTIVQDAWQRGQELTVHGWVYGLQDGLVRDLRTSASEAAQVSATTRAALAAL